MLRSLVLSAVFALVATPLIAFANPQNVEVKIDGMTCASCAKKVTENLQKVPNLDKASVKIDLAANTAKVKVANADAQTIAAIQDAVTKAGYKVTGAPVVTEEKKTN